MDKWMIKWTGEWINEWMDERRVNRQHNQWINEQNNGQIKLINASLNESSRDECENEWLNGKMMNKWMTWRVINKRLNNDIFNKISDIPEIRRWRLSGKREGSARAKKYECGNWERDIRFSKLINPNGQLHV